MDATCAIQDSIHAFSLIHKYVPRILGTYQKNNSLSYYISLLEFDHRHTECD